MLRSLALVLFLGTTINFQCTSQELKSPSSSQKKSELIQPQENSTPLTTTTVKSAGKTAPKLAAASPDTSTKKLPDCVQKDCNCRDFKTQAQAQAVLDAFPNDPHKLDKNKDGRACESLP
jgi:hypothetical protein